MLERDAGPGGRAGGQAVGVGRRLIVRRTQHLVELGADEDLVPTRLRALHEAERQVVEQLVGQHHAVERPGRQFGAHLDLGSAAQGGRAFHRHVAQGRRAGRLGRQDRDRKGAGAGTRLDHDVGIGFAQLVPPAIQGAGEDGTEEPAHLGTGDEVGTAPAGAATSLVEAVVPVVEGQLDHLVEPHRPVPSNQVGDHIADREVCDGQVYGTSEARSPKRARTCGYTPTTTTIDEVIPRAATSDGGTRIGVASWPSGTGLIHISLATAE